MRIGVMGAGAIGCFVGGRLAAGGSDVVLVGRPSVVDDVAKTGLHLTDYRGLAIDVPMDRARFSTSVDALSDRDVVIVTVKGGDTASAIASIAPVLRSGAVVVSLQNGVSNPGVIRAGLAQDHPVLGAMVPFNVLRSDNGRFHQGTSGRIAIQAGENAAALVAALVTSGIGARAVDNIDAVLWGKLLINLNNSVNALAGVPIKEMLGDPAYRRVMAACLREAINVLAHAKVGAVLEPPVPPRVVPFLLSLPNALFRIAARPMVRVDPHARSSMWDDLTRGRKTEIDALNGEIVRLAERTGRAAPKNAAIVALVKAAEGHGSPQMSSSELCARVLG